MDRQRRRSLKLFSSICVATALPSFARAQQGAYPADTVSVIVPYGAGGSTDYFARLMAADMAARHNGKFVVENKPGAAGNIGTRQVALSPPDGRTLLYATATPFSINPFIYQSLPYDPDNGFEAAAMTVQVPLVLVAPVSLGVKTLQELIDYLRKNEASSSFSSYGIGTSSHLSIECHFHPGDRRAWRVACPIQRFQGHARLGSGPQYVSGRCIVGGRALGLCRKTGGVGCVRAEAFAVDS